MTFYYRVIFDKQTRDIFTDWTVEYNGRVFFFKYNVWSVVENDERHDFFWRVSWSTKIEYRIYYCIFCQPAGFGTGAVAKSKRNLRRSSYIIQRIRIERIIMYWRCVYTYARREILMIAIDRMKRISTGPCPRVCSIIIIIITKHV